MAANLCFKKLSAGETLLILSDSGKAERVINSPAELAFQAAKSAHGGARVQAGDAFPHFGETGQRGTESRMSEVKQRQSTPKWRQIDALRHQTVGQLRVKYLEVFRQESQSNKIPGAPHCLAASGERGGRPIRSSSPAHRRCRRRGGLEDSRPAVVFERSGAGKPRSAPARDRNVFDPRISRGDRIRGSAGERVSLSGASLSIAQRGGSAGEWGAVEWR